MAGYGWGVIGAGAVARDFSRALARTPGAARAGVASGQPGNAARFAAEHGFARAHDDVAALVADPAVAVVYVASPTRLHREHALAAIAAGKAVLCEKPFTGSPGDAEAVAEAARAAGVFCMEAMWLRFNATIARLRDLVRAGGLGEVRAAAISIGYAKSEEAIGEGRGALGVFGCYGLSLALDLFGPAGEVRAIVRRDAAGVDRDATAVLDCGGVTVTVDASVSATHANRLEIVGTRAIATIPGNVVDPTTLVVRASAGAGIGLAPGDALLPLRARLPAARGRRGSGMRGEIAEVTRCLDAGLTESAAMPLGHTIAVQRLMARIGETT